MQSRKQPIYLSIVSEVKHLIETKQLQAGERLPSQRQLAVKYQVSHITVQAALKELERTGHVRGRQGAGVYIESLGKTPVRAKQSIMRDAIVVLAPGSLEPICRDHEGGWIQNVTAGALQEIRSRGLHQVVMHPDRICGETIEILASDPPLGVVITETFDPKACREWVLRLKSVGVEVAVRDDYPEFAGFDRVTSDYELGAYSLTKHLIAKGYRRIVQAWDSRYHGYWYTGIRDGYERAMREARLHVSPVLRYSSGPLVATEEMAFEENMRAIAGYLVEQFTQTHPAEAFLLASDGDVPAFSAACRLYSRTRSIDVAIAGYDDYWAGLAIRRYENSPPVATIDKQNATIGAELVRLVIDRVNDRLGPEPQCRIVAPVLSIPPVIPVPELQNNC